MTTNIVTAAFGATRTARTRPLTRIDYGQVLQFEGIELPNVYEVHFSNSLTEDAKTALGGPDGVIIPDEYLVSGKTVYAWVFLHTGADDGETRYTVTIPVEARPDVSDEPPTPEEHSVIGQLIGALETGVEAAEESARIAAEHSVGVATHGNTLVFGPPANQFPVPPEEDGEYFYRVDVDGDSLLYHWTEGTEGRQGPPGEDGASAYDVAVSQGFSGTEAEWLASLKGEPGQNGYTPVKGVDYFDGAPGQDGAPGDDGVSPTIAVTSITGGHRITITDANGAHTVDVMDGAKGNDGAAGAPGAPGSPGVGVPTGGTTGQVLAKASGTNYDTEWVNPSGGSGGENGATFTPSVSSEGVISWTNDKGLNNPDPVNIKGPQGETGGAGATGNGIASIAKTGTSGLVDTYTITYTNGGTATFTVTNGAAGETGAPGYTPVKGVDYFDGAPGQNGSNGTDGYSPTASVSKSGSTVTISITDKNGTTTATVSDGSNGAPGTNGTNGTNGTDGTTFTPSVSSAGVISWSNNGGKTNPASVDLVAAVIAALPSAVGVSF